MLRFNVHLKIIFKLDFGITLKTQCFKSLCGLVVGSTQLCGHPNFVLCWSWVVTIDENAEANL
jgi:hypothetical protein